MKTARKIVVSVVAMLTLTVMVMSCPFNDEPKEIISGAVDISLENQSDSITNRDPGNVKPPYIGEKLQANFDLTGSGDVSFQWRLGNHALYDQRERTLEVLPEYLGSTISVLAYRGNSIGAIISKPTLKVDFDPGSDLPKLPEDALSLRVSGLPWLGETLKARIDENIPSEDTQKFKENAKFIWWRADSRDGELVGTGVMGESYVPGREDVGKYMVVWAVSSGFSTYLESRRVGPITEEATFGIFITPDEIELPRGGTYRFNATITPSDGSHAVIWDLDPASIIAQHSIQQNGELTIHTTAVLGSRITVRAAIDGTEEEATAVVTVTAEPTSVTVTPPSTVYLAERESQQFTAKVEPDGASRNVVWSIDVAETVAVISATGLLELVGAEAGDKIEVKATAIGSAVYGTSNVVVGAYSIRIDEPKQVDMPPGGSYTFTATVSPEEDAPAVLWSVDSADADITQTGALTIKPAAAINRTIKVRAELEDTGIYDEATVTVKPVPSGVTIVPPAYVELERGGLLGIHTFEARVQPSGAPQQVEWTVEKGGQYASVSIDGGRLTVTVNADATLNEEIVVKAASKWDETKFAEATARVVLKVGGAFEIDLNDLDELDIALDAGKLSISDEKGKTLTLREDDIAKHGIVAVRWIYESETVQELPLPGGASFIFVPLNYGTDTGVLNVTVEVLVNGAWYSQVVEIEVVVP
ncbi:MAG: Ig-like domain-containing protein [Treponema sp.]|nr:Ig-like domain-containing protein [Treponema sp.]